MVSIGVLNEFLDHLNARREMKGKKFSLVKKFVSMGNGCFSFKRNRIHLELKLSRLRRRVQRVTEVGRGTYIQFDVILCIGTRELSNGHLSLGFLSPL